METYIDLLLTLDRISLKQNQLWKRAINKKLFKETMRVESPDMVPSVTPFINTTPFIENLSYPLVIKPTNMTGSSFVSVIRDQNGLNDYLKNIDTYDSMIKKIGRQPELVVEEFVEGPQYSMNVYINNVGEVAYCPLIRVVPAFELGRDDTYSALQYNSGLPAASMSSLRVAIEKVVKIFELRNTSAHFDCILSPDGWKICEVGLRIGGNRQPFFHLSHGFSHFQNDLLNRLGKAVELGHQENTVAIIQKAPDRQGHLKETRYSAPQDKRVNFYLDKLKDEYPKAGPVKTGGVTTFRAFLSGSDGELVIELATKIFEGVEFRVDNN